MKWMPGTPAWRSWSLDPSPRPARPALMRRRRPRTPVRMRIQRGFRRRTRPEKRISWVELVIGMMPGTTGTFHAHPSAGRPR